MGTKFGVSLSLLLLGLISMGQNGCPPNAPPPVFDATGTYTGTWEGMTLTNQQVMDCPLTMVLEHDVNAGPIANRTLRGTVTIDFSCAELPEGVSPAEAGVVQATFLLNNEGGMGTIVPACVPGAPICVALGLNGVGQDLDDDGFMDVYGGDWSYQLLLPGIPAFGITGTFMVEVTESMAP